MKSGSAWVICLALTGLVAAQAEDLKFFDSEGSSMPPSVLDEPPESLNFPPENYSPYVPDPVGSVPLGYYLPPPTSGGYRGWPAPVSPAPAYPWVPQYPVMPLFPQVPGFFPGYPLLPW